MLEDGESPRMNMLWWLLASVMAMSLVVLLAAIMEVVDSAAVSALSSMNDH